jgi:hypothetical protein
LRWYRIAITGDPVPLTLLAEAIPALANNCFVIRNPEARCLDRVWDSSTLHDGRVISGSDLLDLVGSMLLDGCFWCELDSNNVVVHVAEEAVYVGLSSDQSPQPASLLAEVVANSPYSETPDTPPYRAATPDYWIEVERLLESRGSLLLLTQWAGGIGGEMWYHLRSSEDIGVATGELLPRSVIAVFDPSNFVVVGESNSTAIGALIQSDPSHSNLRWLTPAKRPKLVTRRVDDDQDLRRVINTATPGTIFFDWPEPQVDKHLLASCPDEDGAVRTEFRFA